MRNLNPNKIGNYVNANLLEVNLPKEFSHDDLFIRVYSVDTMCAWLNCSRTYINDALKKCNEQTITFFRPSDKGKRWPLTCYIYYISTRPFFISIKDK
jgi:hypothetical protein